MDKKLVRRHVGEHLPPVITDLIVGQLNMCRCGMLFKSAALCRTCNSGNPLQPTGWWMCCGTVYHWTKKICGHNGCTKTYEDYEQPEELRNMFDNI